MKEEKGKAEEIESGSITEILRERERLSKIIDEKFKKEVTILFTDICGYTQFVETRGDISGRNMLQKHNDIVMPCIAQHKGVVIKTIGDAVMATFETPLEAVKAAVDIQNGLYEHNRKADPSANIHVKIGINSGPALVDEGDVFGDAVNVAARIQSQAGEGVILISKNLHEQICGSEDILCRFHDTAELKGKAEPLELYRVIWKDDVFLSSKPMGIAPVGEVRIRGDQPVNVLTIDVVRVENRLKISAYEQKSGESSTVRHYDEIPVSMDKISIRCREMVENLNKANRKSYLTRDSLVKLREIGQVFSDDMFPHSVKEIISKTKAEHMTIKLDDQLVQIPWELLHDGKHFMCQRFSMGRLVRTRQNIVGSARALARPLKMLILADPRGDLKGAYTEGTQIRDAIDRDKDLINVTLRSDGITPDFVREKIRNFDLVHFAGHSDYDVENPAESGWRLSTGNLTAQDIIKMGGTSTMPTFIFSNACQSARTEEWDIKSHFQDEIFGLANAFVLAGVKHYVGTFWEVLDEPSRRFALEFYKQGLRGLSIGEAVRQARLALIREYGEESIVWGSYILYGDPTYNYMDQIMKTTVQAMPHEPAPSPVSLEREAIRATEDVIDFSEREGKKRPFVWLAAAAAIIVALSVVLWGYPGILKNGTAESEKAALAYYLKGNFDEAFNASKILEEKNPNLRMAYLIQGDIHFRKGEMDPAEAAYRRALEASNGTGRQKARVLMGMGRIASLRNQIDAALDYYKQATQTDPAGKAGYLSQALLMDESGNSEAALNLLNTARKLAPEDRALAVITDETQKKVSLAKDQEKQARIDQLVNELLESMKSPPRALPSDGWTSVPLTLWMMDFKTTGYSLNEGEERLLASGITDQLLQHSRIHLVERALLDAVLGELKLGSSKLIDRGTALSLGKLLAARLILSGQIVHAGPETQVSMRLFETETGRITATVNEAFGSAVSASVLSDKLAENLKAKLEKQYPLQGKISNVKGDEVTLNIGQKVGVGMGRHFQVVKEDITLEVVEVNTDTSLAKVIKGEKALVEGQRIVESK